MHIGINLQWMQAIARLTPRPALLRGYPRYMPRHMATRALPIALWVATHGDSGQLLGPVAAT